VNALLDTHVFAWALAEPDQLSAEALSLIRDTANILFVSIVTPWQLAIKLRLGKDVALPPNVGLWFSEALMRASSRLLPIEVQHVAAVEHLPLHHRDPFDRLLIAQARSERLTIVTRDRRFAPYDVPIIWT
jgi:PIN domain nuclease of toxin-antitoxin system